MSEQFINPNWHVLIIHYPLALITLGLIIEIFSFFWSRSLVRTAGRWMIVLGALSCIPAITVGLYAFRQVANPAADDDAIWREVWRTSAWSDEQRLFMTRHMWFAIAGSVCTIIAAISWLACSNVTRNRLYYPALLLAIVGAALLAVAGWYSGESVYRHGTAVAVAASSAEQPAATTAAAATEPARTQPAARAGVGAVIHHEHENGHEEAERTAVTYYFPPLQVHVLFAGLTVAFAIGAFGVTLRRWNSELVPFAAFAGSEHIERALDMADEITRREAMATHAGAEAAAAPPAPAVAPTPLFPARIWLAGIVAGLLTALAGVWLNLDWTLQALVRPIQEPVARTESMRLFVHVIFGLSIVVLAVILALLTRFARRQRAITTFFSVILLLAVAGQIWLGVLLLFDSVRGPLIGFNV